MYFYYTSRPPHMPHTCPHITHPPHMPHTCPHITHPPHMPHTCPHITHQPHMPHTCPHITHPPHMPHTCPHITHPPHMPHTCPHITLSLALKVTPAVFCNFSFVTHQFMQYQQMCLTSLVGPSSCTIVLLSNYILTLVAVIVCCHGVHCVCVCVCVCVCCHDFMKKKTSGYMKCWLDIFLLDFSSEADEKHQTYLQEREELLKQNKVSYTLPC